MTEHLTIGTWHYPIEADDLGRYAALGVAVDHIARHCTVPPDLLGWTAAEWLVEERDQMAMRWLATRLSEASGGVYEPFPTSPAFARRGATILFVNRLTVRVNKWHPDLDPRPDWGWLGATLWGQVPAMVSAQHWTGECDGDFWALHSSAYRRSEDNTILLGQLRQTSSWVGEVPCDFDAQTQGAPELRSMFGTPNGDDRWRAHTRQVDHLRANGFLDAGEQAGVGTPTRDNGPRIRCDRILFSRQLRAGVVPGSYQTHEPSPVMPPDVHRLVTVQLRLERSSRHERREAAAAREAGTA